MRAYLMTRGTLRSQDYAFLGEAPSDQWWDAVTPWVFLESEELIVRRRAGGGTGLVISGIPSRRTDVLGTRVRHTVVVDGVHHDQRLALWLVRCGLDDGERRRLGEALDGAFDGDFVDALMSGGDDDIGIRLLDTLRRAAEGAGEEGTAKDVTGSWAGAVHDETATRAFLARVRRLLEGDATGYALTTHALSSRDGVERLAATVLDEVAVLLHDSNLRGVEWLGKASVPAPRRDRAIGDRRARAVVLALTGVAMALGVWWLIRQL
ncbi:hypothetical protein ACXNSR_13130 [Streptomyces sp. NC-S4]